MSFYAYLLASRPYGTLYCGSTDDLVARVWQHREKMLGGFTARYGVSRLVWFTLHDSRDAALEHKRRIKEWRRKWKVELIERENPDWRDLYADLMKP